MSYTLLIVEDEPDLLRLLEAYFSKINYHTLTAKSGKEAIKQAANQPDLILLDIGLPDFNGLEVCQRIRDHVSCPILFLTAKIQETDKLSGFAVGGDDYILKPFSIDELAARIAAHIRRDLRHTGKTKAKFADDLVIDYSAKEVYYDNQALSLAKKEFEIIEFLSLHNGQVFDKERIYELLWGYDSDGNASVVAEHIRRIRAKFMAAGVKSHIETVWGLGYKWVSL